MFSFHPNRPLSTWETEQKNTGRSVIPTKIESSLFEGDILQLW
jgi:hypothetical protein